MIAELQTYHNLDFNLRDCIHSDRCAQFVDRLSWNLKTIESRMEIDEYDDEKSEYLVVRHRNAHLASCRLRDVEDPTMVLDHFDEVFPLARHFVTENAGSVMELTRFLRSPSANSRQTWMALKRMGESLELYRQRRDLTGFVAVVFRPISRLLRLNGVDFDVLETSTIDGKPADLIFLTNTIPNSHLQRLKDMTTPSRKQ